MTTTSTPRIEGLDDPSEVLVFARQCRINADRAEADLLGAAVTWAQQHPPESIHEAAVWARGMETDLQLGGAGVPRVAEFCVAEFAAAIGSSTEAGKAVISDGLELKYRLPKHWARVHAGQLPAWRARRVAQATMLLSVEAAGFVDAQLAPFAHKVGFITLERLVQEAINRFMPDLAAHRAEQAADGRHVSFHHDQVTFNGTTRIEGELDLADALDLDAALTHGAHQLALAGSPEPLDARRAMAAGEIARHQLALDLANDTATDTATEGQRGRSAPRQVVLYVHLSEAAVRGEAGAHLGRVENTRTGVTADQVRGWCANPDTAITVKPVIDLNEHIHVEAYEVPNRLDELTNLRDHTCVFPWCQRRAENCDSEHCVPYDSGGTTCNCNIAPVCRRHHRIKTHSTWGYTTLEPGSFLWTSPHGYQFLRDHHGTVDVTPKRPPPGPDEAQHFY